MLALQIRNLTYELKVKLAVIIVCG